MPFITFEGIEGCGKSTQVQRLAERLGSTALLTREPGGTAIGHAIREVLLDPENRNMASTTEVLLYFADRAQHVAEVIRPALARGLVVLCDRYVETSLAYQGYGRGLPLDAIRSLAHLATGGLRPETIVLFDVPIDVGLARAAKRGAHDRIESEVLEFHERVLAGYDELVAQDPSRWLRLDGQGSPDAVFQALWRGLASRGFVSGEAA